MSIDSTNSPKKSGQKGCFYKVINILFIIGLIIAAYWAFQFFFANPEDSNNEGETTVQEENTSETLNGNAIDVETLEITENPLSRINFQKVGTVTPYKSATLTSEASGVLQDFTVEEGDLVIKGDEIVSISDSISTEVAQINYDNALNTLENAKDSYNSTVDSVNKSAEIASIGVETAQLNYDNAILSKQNLEKTLEEQIRSAKIGVQQAQLALQAAQEAYFNTDATYSITLDNTLDQSLTSMNSTLSLVDNSVDSVDSLLAMQSTLGGDVRSYDIDDLQNSSEDIFDDYLDIRDEYYDVQGTQDLNDTKNLLKETIDLVEDTQSMLNDAKDIIDDAEIDLSTLNVSYNTLLASLDQSKNGLYMTSQNLESTVINNQIQPEGTLTQVEMAQQQVASALQQLKQLEEARESQLDSADYAIEVAAKQVDSAQAQYSNTLAGGELQKIGAQTQVDSLEGQADIAKANLGGTILTSPFDGTIMEKMLDTGNYVNPSQKIVTVADITNVYITVSLTTEELSYVKLGQSVSIKAPGGIEKEGKVTKVLPTLDATSKKVDVKILIPNEENELLSGMFADVTFLDAQSESPRLLIPFKSVVFEQNIPYVFIVKNNKAFKTEITLGATSGNEVEVVDGLSQGDKVITEGAKLVKDGDSVSVKNEGSE